MSCMRSCVRGGVALAVASIAAIGSFVGAAPDAKDVVPGIPTHRQIPGFPFDLLGNRVMFMNWDFIQPGDLNWIDKNGKSVYVHGDGGPFDAQFVSIRAPHGIRIMAQKPVLVPTPDRPHRCILQDGGKYLGWSNNEYYESEDGLKWIKKANMKFDKEKDGLGQIFIDSTAPASERFKAAWSDDEMTTAEFDAFRKKRPDGWEPRSLVHYLDNKTISCVRGSVSADGITWKTLPDPLMVEYSDNNDPAYYDPLLKQYVIYTRQWAILPRTTKLPADINNSWTGTGRRAIGRAASDNFREFPPSDLMLKPSLDMAPSEQLYTNCHSLVPGAPNQHVMFPTIWNGSITDSTRIAMAVSSDGIHYDWVPGGNLMDPGPYGSWNGGCIWSGFNLIELRDGTWALPYGGQILTHKYPRKQQKSELAYAEWPHGRLVCVEAQDQGEFTIMPVMAPGHTLKINAVTNRTGKILVEQSGDKDRTADKCVPIVGDAAWTTVRWQGADGLAVKDKEPVGLRFVLDKAQIFGIEFD